jgi:hypothetical protein
MKNSQSPRDLFRLKLCWSELSATGICNEKSASVDRWREVATATAASVSAKAERMRGARR